MINAAFVFPVLVSLSGLYHACHMEFSLVRITLGIGLSGVVLSGCVDGVGPYSGPELGDPAGRPNDEAQPGPDTDTPGSGNGATDDDNDQPDGPILVSEQSIGEQEAICHRVVEFSVEFRKSMSAGACGFDAWLLGSTLEDCSGFLADCISSNEVAEVAAQSIRDRCSVAGLPDTCSVVPADLYRCQQQLFEEWLEYTEPYAVACDELPGIAAPVEIEFPRLSDECRSILERCDIDIGLNQGSTEGNGFESLQAEGE